MTSIGSERQNDRASSPPDASTRSSCSLAGRTRLHMMRAVFESSTMRTRIGITSSSDLSIACPLQVKTHRYRRHLLAGSLHQLGRLARRVEPVGGFLHHLVLVEDRG